MGDGAGYFFGIVLLAIDVGGVYPGYGLLFEDFVGIEEDYICGDLLVFLDVEEVSDFDISPGDIILDFFFIVLILIIILEGIGSLGHLRAVAGGVHN